MKMNKISIILILAIVVSMGVQLVFTELAQSAETRIVRIYGEVGPNASTRIEPAHVWVTPGTVLVFTNWSQTEVKISFENDTLCDEATEAAVGFIAAKSCYVTDMWIPHGGTSSLKFNKIGTYNFKVIYKISKSEEKGQLIVRPVSD